MTRFGFSLAALFAVFAAGPATGQTKEIQDELERKLAKARAAGRTEEHIEIFRRLLNRGLVASLDLSVNAPENCPAFQHGYGDLGYYPPASALLRKAQAVIDPNRPGSQEGTLLRLIADATGSDPNQPWVNLHSRFGKLQPPALAEGVHLPGRGVVFTATVPIPSRNPLGTGPKVDDKPLSAWERERRALRGDSDEKVAKTDSGLPSVSETILKLLAENGKHFAELGPDEPVTVAVVFRPGKLFSSEQCALCHQLSHKAMWKYWMTDDRSGTGDSPGSSGKTPSSSGSERGEIADPRKPADSIVDLFRNGLALGHLHLKQGKPREAAKVYRDLIGRCGETLEALEKLPPETSAPDRLHVVRVAMEVYAKLAQAQLELHDDEAVVKTLKEWQAFSDKYVQLAAAPKPDPAAKALANPVPARLVISAPKKLLDQVGSGKISFDEFRKAATIEYTGSEKDGKP
jgi:hypothetical protein